MCQAPSPGESQASTELQLRGQLQAVRAELHLNRAARQRLQSDLEGLRLRILGWEETYANADSENRADVQHLAAQLVHFEARNTVLALAYLDRSRWCKKLIGLLRAARHQLAVIRLVHPSLVASQPAQKGK